MSKNFYKIMRVFIKVELMIVSFVILITIIAAALVVADNKYLKDYSNNTKEGTKISKGDCRIVNPKLAYDNDYDLYFYEFGKGNVHAFSVDNMGVIRDISNISKDGKADNYEGKIFEEFNKNNKSFKVLTHVKYSNREIFYVKKDDNGFDATSELYNFYLGVQYLYFKYLRNTDN